MPNSYVHERSPPVDMATQQPLAFPVLRKGETVRMVIGEDAVSYGGATCVIVSTIKDDGKTYEVASCVARHGDKWALVHHFNGALLEQQRNKDEFSARVAREMLLSAAKHCMLEGNELDLVSMFLAFAEMLAAVEVETMQAMAKRYAEIVGKVLTDKTGSVPQTLREAVARTQDQIINKSNSNNNPPPKPTNPVPMIAPSPAPNTSTPDNSNTPATESLACALSSCSKKDNLRRCGACKKVYYCSQDHQRADWGAHKPKCTSK